MSVCTFNLKKNKFNNNFSLTFLKLKKKRKEKHVFYQNLKNIMSRNRDPFNENPNTYLYDSINTRVPPMNISGKKSTPTLARMRMESPVNIHSHSFQNLPKAPMIVRRESPFMNRGESPIMIRRESPQPSFFYEPERERVFMPPPQPLIRSARPVVYRPALMNLTNRIPNPLINLNPFEVVEHLFLEENSKITCLMR